jgi:D-amino-acid dehydrogenase
MMPNLMPRVGRGKAPTVFYNTGHGHLGWTLSAATADIIADTIVAASGRERGGGLVAPARVARAA